MFKALGLLFAASLWNISKSNITDCVIQCMGFWKGKPNVSKMNWLTSKNQRVVSSTLDWAQSQPTSAPPPSETKFFNCIPYLLKSGLVDHERSLCSLVKWNLESFISFPSISQCTNSCISFAPTCSSSAGFIPSSPNQTPLHQVQSHFSRYFWKTMR